MNVIHKIHEMIRRLFFRKKTTQESEPEYEYTFSRVENIHDEADPYRSLFAPMPKKLSRLPSSFLRPQYRRVHNLSIGESGFIGYVWVYADGDIYILGSQDLIDTSDYRLTRLPGKDNYSLSIKSKCLPMKIDRGSPSGKMRIKEIIIED